MRIHYLQHVHFEDLANIQFWAQPKKYPITRTLLYENEKLPALENFDWLFIMGGPMNVYQEKEYAWLVAEKKFIGQAIQQGKVVVGICLGAQLIADVLGARVYANPFKEIGWHPIELTPEARHSKLFGDFPEKFTTFQWHGDTFDLPSGSRWLAKSPVCPHQAFEYQEIVIALQFHFESSIMSIQKLISHGAGELVSAPYIQTAEKMVVEEAAKRQNEKLMNLFLNNLEKLSQMK